MAGYDETDFPVGDFARIITGASSKTVRRTRDLEKLDAASKQRVVPRMGTAEAGIRNLTDWSNGQDRAIGEVRGIANSAQSTANDARNRAINAQASANTANGTANSAYNRTTDLYNQVADLRRRIEILERK